MNKTCCVCKQEKSADEFYAGEYRCSACSRERRKRYYYANRQEEQRKAREYQANDRESSRERSASYYRRNVETQRARKREDYRKMAYGSASPIVDRNEKETWVYQCFDVGGRLIYVGISVSFHRRLKEHAKGKSWWSEVAGVSLTKCVDRQTAEQLEKQLIETLLPIHNVALKPIQ